MTVRTLAVRVMLAVSTAVTLIQSTVEIRFAGTILHTLMDIISSLTMQIILKIKNFITNPILAAA